MYYTQHGGLETHSISVTLVFRSILGVCQPVEKMSVIHVKEPYQTLQSTAVIA